MQGTSFNILLMLKIYAVKLNFNRKLTMEILVDRFISDDETSISRVTIDGNFECFGLEDEYREDKIAGETRIPAGTYQIELRTEGGFHTRHLKRYGKLHKGMLHVLDVPNFTYILIHCGNTEKNTAGCLLVGTSANTAEGDMSISASRAAYKKFYPKVCDAAERKDLTITYVDNDR
jgi:hypothetical protein